MVDPDFTEQEEAREPDDQSLDLPENVSVEADGEDSAAAPTDQEPETPTAEATLEARLDRLEDSLASGLESLHEAFKSKLAYDRHKDQQIDRLHDELQEHKKDLLARTIRPWIHGLIRLHDDLGRTTDALGERPPEELTTERFFKTLAGFGEDLVLLLERNGVRPFEGSGEDFDPQRQTAARRVETADPEQVGRIADRIRPGFEQGTVVLQKERVAVYVAASAALEAQPAAETEDRLPAASTSDIPPQPES